MNTCVICHDDDSKDEFVRQLSGCGHWSLMHKKCLEKWLKRKAHDLPGVLSGSCPLCREPMVLVTDEYEQDFDRAPSILKIILHTVFFRSVARVWL